MREIPSHKICVKCKELKPASAFQKQAAMRCGLASWCHKCSNIAGREKQKAWKKLPHAKQKRNASLKLYFQTEKGKAALERRKHGISRLKYQARWFLLQRIKSGKVIRPSVCSKCPSTDRIEAHHHKGYEREHWLDVEWLCFDCHRVADRVTPGL